MANGNIRDPDFSKEGQQTGNNSSHTYAPDIRIVGYNLLGLAGYTIISAISIKEGGIIFDSIFLVVHVLLCIILAIAYKRWVWLLSGLAVLLIGFSTCVGGLWKLL